MFVIVVEFLRPIYISTQYVLIVNIVNFKILFMIDDD